MQNLRKKLEKSCRNSQDYIFYSMQPSCQIIVHAPNVNISSKADDDGSTCASHKELILKSRG